jgi:ABC-type uncharacterized transport system involved in gliding motility auxiliary subunit
MSVINDKFIDTLLERTIKLQQQLDQIDAFGAKVRAIQGLIKHLESRKDGDWDFKEAQQALPLLKARLAQNMN